MSPVSIEARQYRGRQALQTLVKVAPDGTIAVLDTPVGQVRAMTTVKERKRKGIRGFVGQTEKIVSLSTQFPGEEEFHVVEGLKATDEFRTNGVDVFIAAEYF